MFIIFQSALVFTVCIPALFIWGRCNSFRLQINAGVQVKLWDLLRMRAIPERLKGVFTRRYTNPRLRLRLPLPVVISH